jgi:hypothetical protein
VQLLLPLLAGVPLPDELLPLLLVDEQFLLPVGVRFLLLLVDEQFLLPLPVDE